MTNLDRYLTGDEMHPVLYLHSPTEISGTFARENKYFFARGVAGGRGV